MPVEARSPGDLRLYIPSSNDLLLMITMLVQLRILLKNSLLFFKVSFEGGSGSILFEPNGDRPGYTAVVYNFNPISDTPANSPEAIWVSGTWDIDPHTLEVTEAQYDTRLLPGNVQIPGYFAYPPIDYFNERV